MADVLVTFDGVIVVLGSIYRKKVNETEVTDYVVYWDSITYFEDKYQQEIIENEIIDRYYDWKEKNGYNDLNNFKYTA